jgi:hypothetical protein
MQGQFYKEAGIDAWNNKIPYKITNNLTLAYSYANVIWRFFQEYTSRQHADPGPPPFIIVELGAGSGMFAFYLIKELLELRTHLNRPDLTFKYIMTDFSAKNIAYWRNQPALRQYVRYGDEEILDFAEYTVGEETASLHLLESGLHLNHSTYDSEEAKPWVVIANYVFDTLPQDIFQVRDGNLLAGLTPETIPEYADETESQNNAKSFQQLGIDIEYHSAQLPYYNHEHLDTILSSYKDTLRNQSFLFPITVLKGINNLLHLSGQKLLLLATDKASTEEPPPLVEGRREIIFHGASFSMTANFHALRALFQSIGGKSLNQPMAHTITTSLFLAGEGLQSLYETEQSFSTFLINYNPFGLWHYSRKLEPSINTFSTEDLLSYLNLMRWDPDVIDKCLKIIIAQAKTLTAATLKPFSDGMRRSGDYFYALPGPPSTLINVGNFFYELEDFASALTYYERSIMYCEEEKSVTFQSLSCRISLCRYHLHRKILLEMSSPSCSGEAETPAK